ncbi:MULTISPECIES: hypothetical protein [unclassified Lysobacter]|uniref:hypothetical protein n=1 Tax=unclassified Lysobacter TaxID=2635362 RepID=UPI000B0ED0D7|nr:MULTISPECIES: hypothetical protein [unclassified Lysobacter]
MKRTIDERSGGATAWIRPVGACQDLLRYAASLLRSAFWTPLVFAFKALDRPAAYSPRPVRATFADAAADRVGMRSIEERAFQDGGPRHRTLADPATASRPDARKRGRTTDGGAASKPQIERERERGMDRYGRWSRDGTWPPYSGVRSRPPAADRRPDRFASQTAALAR